MKNHDPREQVRGLHQILTSDKKRVGFLFGAGTSFATGLDGISVPAIAKMTSDIVQHVTTQSAALASAIDDITAELSGEKIAFNIESLLSSIESKRAVIGSGTLNGLDSNGFSELAMFNSWILLCMPTKACHNMSSRICGSHLPLGHISTETTRMFIRMSECS